MSGKRTTTCRDCEGVGLFSPHRCPGLGEAGMAPILGNDGVPPRGDALDSWPGWLGKANAALPLQGRGVGVLVTQAR
jgi:hypothetical protein